MYTNELRDALILASKIQALLDRGMSWKQVSERMGVAHTETSRWLARIGFKALRVIRAQG